VAATIASGQHLIDIGNSVGGAITTTAAVVLRLDGEGAINVNGDTYFGMSGAGGNLFLRVNDTHQWYWPNEANPTYDWQAGTVNWRDRATDAGEMVCGFSTGTFQLNHQSAGTDRSFQVNANHTVAPNAASDLRMVGQQDGTLDQWEIYAAGNQTYLRMRSDQYVDLYPGGINSVATFTDVGIRLFAQDYMRFTTGYFALVNVENEDVTGTRFCRAPSGSGIYYAYGAGVNGNPLNVATDLASSSEFYAYGADVNHSAGSGTVGFLEFRDNGTVKYRVMLDGNVRPKNVAYDWPSAVAAGANYVLTDAAGDGTLSWAAVSAGDVSATTGADTRVAVFNSATGITGSDNFAYNDATTGSPTAFTLTQPVNTTNTPIGLVYTAAAHTGVNAEIIDLDFDTGRTVTFASGAGNVPTTQRATWFRAPTYSNDAGAISQAATVYIDGAPSAGGSLTISNAYALWVDSGEVQFDGTLDVLSSVTLGNTTAKVKTADGSNVLTIEEVAGSTGDVFLVNTGASGSNFLTLTQRANTSGTPKLLLLTGAAHTDATGEVIDAHFDLARTVTFQNGAAPTTQRTVWFEAATYSSGGVQTTTTAATVYIEGPPVAAGSLTITNPWALWVDSGNVRFDGNVGDTNNAVSTAYITNITPGTGATFSLNDAGGNSTISITAAGVTTLNYAVTPILTTHSTGITYTDDKVLAFGGTGDSSIEWDTAQTNGGHALVIRTSLDDATINASGNIIITNIGTGDLGFAAASHPTLYITSFTTPTTDPDHRLHELRSRRRRGRHCCEGWRVHDNRARRVHILVR
jgi:hypothetical protein